jgi:hypothetical protein
MFRSDASQVVTFAPDGVTDPRWLGQLGHVAQLKYSFAMPGGADQMSCLLQISTASRRKAFDPGRIVMIYRGAIRVWEGQLDESTPSDTGWELTAHGAGTYGQQFMAKYTTWNPDDVVNQAISRGLRWVNGGITGSPFYGQQTDSASITVADHLTNITGPANLTWYVDTGPSANTFSIFSPGALTVPNRLLIATAPAQPTLHGYWTRLFGRYQATKDTTKAAATFGTTNIDNTAQVARHGPLETFIDLTQSGVMSAGTAQGILTTTLAKYVAASYSDAFVVTAGNLRNMGGQPIDLGTEQAGTVCQLMLAAQGYGGELAPVFPITFLVGQYEYDNDTDSGTVTPFVSERWDLAGLFGNYVTTHHQANPTSHPLKPKKKKRKRKHPPHHH